MAEFQQDFYPEFERAPEIIIGPDGEEVDGRRRSCSTGTPPDAGRADHQSRRVRRERRCSTRSRTTSGATTITDFWTFGGANSTGTYILTALGVILMVGALDRLGPDGERQARAPGRDAPSIGAFEPARRPRRADREEDDGASRSTSTRCRRKSRWLAPFMIGLSLICTLIVVVILLTDLDGPFIGPWG